MDNQNVMVSIVCATYNHEKFIPDALNSILMQKTDFAFEVLIGEDCSPDRSRAVLKDFEARYPGKFQMFYRETNYGAAKNVLDLYQRTRGKYLISLELDDFWVDPYKLQKQVDFLEAHPEYVSVAHPCIMVNEAGECLGLRYPECHRQEFRLKDFRKGLFPGQTTTLLSRNFYRADAPFANDFVTDPAYLKGPGDSRRNFMLAANGRVACLPDVMSAYRFNNATGSSFTATQDRNFEIKLSYKRLFVDYAVNLLGTKESIYTAEFMLFKSLFTYTLKRKVSVKQLLKEWMLMHQPIKIGFAVIGSYVVLLFKRLFGKHKTYQPLDEKTKKQYCEILDSFREMEKEISQ